jgi:hypothetical protein
MTSALIKVMNYNATCGLYATPGIEYFANSILVDKLTKAIEMMHLRQPRTKDYVAYGTLISDLYLCELPEYPFGRVVMCCGALCRTYIQIENAFLAVARVAVAIHQKTINVADDWAFPRIIPDGLEEMRLPSLAAITQDDIHRIWCAQPFAGYMEMLRAERHRVMHAMTDSKFTDAIMRLQLVLEKISYPQRTIMQTVRRKYHTARRSVRRSTDMYNRLGKRDLLDRFLQSSPLQPLIIPGHRYDFHLIKKQDLLSNTVNCDNGVGAVTCVVCQKDTHNHLGEICVYFPETPPLDHVLATELYLRTPEREMDLLRAACFIDANTAFYHDPILPELKGISHPNEMPISTVGINFHACSDPDHQRMRSVNAHLPDLLLLVGLSFLQIMHVGPRYLPLLADCGRFDPDDFLVAVPEAMEMVETLRKAMEQGEF